jgi:hypothetical protein
MPSVKATYNRELKHVGRQHDDEGQNKFLQINDSKENLSYIIIGFMFGKSSTEPNFKLHLLRLEMQALYKIRENLRFAVVNRATTTSVYWLPSSSDNFFYFTLFQVNTNTKYTNWFTDG